MFIIISNYLNDITETEDGFYMGYIDSTENYNQFLRALKDAGFYFSVRDSEKFKEDGQFLFKCNKSNLPVPFSGCPFRREKNITYQCAFGSQYYGKVKKQGSSEMVIGKYEKKSGRVRHSMKLGCKAKMAAKCIRVYLDYAIPSESSHWRLKKEVVSHLKQDLLSKECEVKSLSRYFVKISGADQHCHSPMHPRGVIRKLLVATKCKSRVLAAEEKEVTVACNALVKGGMTYEAVYVVEEEGGVDLRELCCQKGREVATLSQHLCHDEDQLRELLSALTQETNCLNESQLEVVEAGGAEGGLLPPDDMIVDDQMCSPSDVSEIVVIEEPSETDAVRGIYLSGDMLSMKWSEEGDLGNGAQSGRLHKRITSTPGLMQTFQKETNSSVAEISSELEVQECGDLNEGSVVYYLLG